MKDIIKILIIPIGIVIAVSFFLNSYSIALAEDEIFFTTNFGGNAGFQYIHINDVFCQTFYANDLPITKIQLRIEDQLSPHTGNLTFTLSDTGCGISPDSEITYIAENIDHTIAQWIDWDLSQQYATGTKVYFNAYSDAVSYTNGFEIVIKDYYTSTIRAYRDGVAQNGSLLINAYNNESEYYTDLGQTSGFDYSLDPDFPDFATVNSQTCMIGQNCNLWFTYNNLSVGDVMHLVYYASSTIPSNSISSTTITQTSNWQNKISVPAVTVEGDVLYNMLLVDPVYGYIIKTGIAVKWVDDDYWNDLIKEKYGADVEEFCAEAVICADVATSSDFFYGFNCGAREALCWALSPTNNAKKYALNSVKALEESFPFNMIFIFLHRLDTIIKDQEQSTSTIDMPFIDGEGNYYMLPVISSTTVPTALGTSFDTVKNGLIYFIWIMVAGIIVLIVITAL